MNSQDSSAFESGPEASQEDEVLALADAGFEEDLPAHLRRVSDGYGRRLNALYPHAHMTTEIARGLVSAGFELHDCAARARTGGVCLTACAAKSGVIVTWTVHDVLAFDHSRHYEDADVHEVMNNALAEVLTVQGWRVEAFGQSSAHLVTGRAPARTAAFT